MRKSTRDDSKGVTMTDAMWARMMPLAKAPAYVRAAVGRGRPKLAHPRQMVSLRVAPTVLAAYRATGKGWQSLMHQTLADHAPRASRAPRKKARAGSRPNRKEAR